MFFLTKKGLKKQSFIAQLFRDSWTIAVEHARYMKAMRILSKQEWSIEFLTMLLRKANSPLTLIIRNGGNEIIVSKETATHTDRSQLAERDLMEYLGIVPEQNV
jgi:hypothetical protein